MLISITSLSISVDNLILYVFLDAHSISIDTHFIVILVVFLLVIIIAKIPI